MTTTRVRAHERRNQHGGIEHVKEHSRRVDNTTDPTNNNEINFEDLDQEEKEEDNEVKGNE